jgi:hypothetical protein
LLDYLDEDLLQVVLRHGGQRVSERGTEVCSSVNIDVLLVRVLMCTSVKRDLLLFVLVSKETYYYLY